MEHQGRDNELPDETPRTRRSFFFFGALAAAAMLPRTAQAQDSRRSRRVLTPRPDKPSYNIGVVNESVPALPDWANTKARLVRRITMGATAGQIMRVNQLGYQEYLNRQLDYTSIDDTATTDRVAALYPTLSQTIDQLAVANQGTVQNQLQEATIFRAAFSERQLYERMVEFWSDHFNIAITKVQYLKVIDDRNVIRKHALGKFRDLLMASAKSGAMLAYLDQTQSRRQAPNQNYARELMELHTVGVDNGYTQQDVAELSRLLTGWTIQGRGDFRFDPNLHDFGAKVVMGQSFPAQSSSVGAAAIAEGEQFINFLAAHPNTATYVSTKLLRWLLQAEPTATQIGVASRAWKATGGNIKLVVRAILNESWLAAAPAKFKRPFHLVVSALRSVAPTSVTSLSLMRSLVNNVGQPLFFYETPDGYPDTVEYWSGNLMPRWNSLAQIAAQNNNQVRVDTSPYRIGTVDAAIDKINTDFFAGEMSVGLRVALLNYAKAGTFDDLRAREVMALAMSSQEFQWY